jgi:hypothetical protein
MDREFIDDLNLLTDNGEGSTFQWPSSESDEQNIQLEFHKKTLKGVNPSTILETGTHKANFDYFAKTILPDIKIFTFGIDVWSANCVDKVNDYFGEKFISFYQGNSLHTLPNFKPEKQIDLAWVDGGHTEQIAYSDLMQCNRLNIPVILVDDYSLIPEVKNAIKKFVADTEYNISEITKDARGICRLDLPLHQKRFPKN